MPKKTAAKKKAPSPKPRRVVALRDGVHDRNFTHAKGASWESCNAAALIEAGDCAEASGAAPQSMPTG